MSKNTDYTIKGISEDVNAGERFGIALGGFLDAFYRATRCEREFMIAESPLDMENREDVPFLAATADKLANDHDLKVPLWAFEPRCYLPDTQPYFQFKHIKLRCLCMFVSPIEFKHRNIFVTDNVLSRV
jgi:hypothetical protein